MSIYIHILSYYKLFHYFNLCQSVMLDSLSRLLTSILFFGNTFVQYDHHCGPLVQGRPVFTLEKGNKQDLGSRELALGQIISNYFCNMLPFQPETLNRNESGRFGALKSDSTHHFFRNACTKSGSLRFSQFSGC